MSLCLVPIVCSQACQLPIIMLRALPARLLIPNSFTLRLVLSLRAFLVSLFGPLLDWTFLFHCSWFTTVFTSGLLVVSVGLLRGARLTTCYCFIHNGLSIQFVFCGMVGTKEWTTTICSQWWDNVFESLFQAIQGLSGYEIPSGHLLLGHAPEEELRAFLSASVKNLWGYCWKGEVNLMQRKYCPWKCGLQSERWMAVNNSYYLRTLWMDCFQWMSAKMDNLLIIVKQFGNWIFLTLFLELAVEIPGKLLLSNEYWTMRWKQFRFWCDGFVNSWLPLKDKETFRRYW